MTRPTRGGAPDPSDPRRCAATVRRTGERCRSWAVGGSNVCRMHGGAAPQVRRKAGERAVREAALEQARRLGGVIDVDPHEAILSALQEAAANVAVLRGLVASYEVDQVPASILGIYEDERERLVKFAKLAIDAGVPEHRVRVAQEEAHQLASAFERVLDAFVQRSHPRCATP